MIPRELEPEVMDTREEAELYDEMDHTSVNSLFVEDLLRGGPVGPRVLDLGTGTARIPILLAQRHPDCQIMASDAAVNMLEIAKLNVALGGVEHRIQLHHGDGKKLGFEDETFDTTVCNSIVHHIPEPSRLIAEMTRVLVPGGRIFVRDLLRPSSRDAVEALVSMHACDEPIENQQLLRQSLIAALTIDEIRALVADFGFSPDSVNVTSDRHWTWDAHKTAVQ